MFIHACTCIYVYLHVVCLYVCSIAHVCWKYMQCIVEFVPYKSSNSYANNYCPMCVWLASSACTCIYHSYMQVLLHSMPFVPQFTCIRHTHIICTAFIITKHPAHFVLSLIAERLSARHLIAEYWLTLGLYVTMSITLWNANRFKRDVTSFWNAIAIFLC